MERQITTDSICKQKKNLAMGDHLDPMQSLEEGDFYHLETVTEESHEFPSGSLIGSSRQQVSTLSPGTTADIDIDNDNDLERQQNQSSHQVPQRYKDEESDHRGPARLLPDSLLKDENVNDAQEKLDEDDLSASTFGASSQSSMDLDGDIESADVVSNGGGPDGNNISRKRKSARFGRQVSVGNRKTPPTPVSGQQVRIRKASMTAAMDENIRKRHQLRRRLSSKVKQFFAPFDDDDMSSGDESMTMSMHGRLMKQPSQNLPSDRDKNYSPWNKDEEKKRQDTQYRLTNRVTAMRRVSFFTIFGVSLWGVLYIDIFPLFQVRSRRRYALKANT